MTRRIDPDPITIYMAATATVAAAVAITNFVKTHYPPLSTVVRAKLAASLEQLSGHTSEIKEDLAILENIFSNAEFTNGREIRLGNGAYLTPSDFTRYEKVSDSIICRLREVHKICLKIERASIGRTATPIPSATINKLGKIYTQIQRLLETKNVSHDIAWKELRNIADGLEQSIEVLRTELLVANPN